jgi:protein O-mannosyl-transferase
MQALPWYDLATTRRLALAAITLLAMALHWPGLGGGFFSDDFYFLDNPAFTGPPLIEAWRFFAQPANPTEFLPLRDLSLALDWHLWGSNAWGFKLTNWLLYGACIPSSYLAMRAVLCFAGVSETQGRLVSLLSTVLFATHAAHVESVAWISGRKDLLSGLLCFLSFAVFAQGLAANRLGQMLLGSALLGPALLCKGTAIILAPVQLVLVVLAVMRGRVSPGDGGIAGGAVLLACGLFFAYLAKAQGHVMLSATDIGLDWPTRLTNALLILGYLIKMAFLSEAPRLFHDVHAAGPRYLGMMAIAVLAAISSLAALITLARQDARPSRPKVVAAALLLVFLLVALLPYLQLTPYRTWSFASDRFVFLGSFAASGLLAMGCVAMPRRAQSLAIGVLVLTAAFHAGVTVQRSAEWRATDQLVLLDARREPSHKLAQKMAIRNYYLPRGQFGEASNAAMGVGEPAARRFLVALVEFSAAQSAGDVQRMRENLVIMSGDAGSILASFSPQDRRSFQREATALGLYQEAAVFAVK